jgi:hypothetical protein
MPYCKLDLHPIMNASASRLGIQIFSATFINIHHFQGRKTFIVASNKDLFYLSAVIHLGFPTRNHRPIFSLNYSASVVFHSLQTLRLVSQHVKKMEFIGMAGSESS